MFLQKTSHRLLTLFILVSFNLISQKEVRLSDLSACAVLHSNETVEEARKAAVFNVKLVALQEAGISELITSNQFFDVKKGSSTDKDTYYESTFADLKGEISRFDIISYNQSVGETGEVNVCVKANVSVVKFDAEPKDRINLLVEGVDSRYKNGDPISMKITSPKSAYYWVFLIDGEGNYSLLYPQNIQQPNLLASNQAVSLPDKSVYWNVNTMHKQGEKNSLLLVSYPENAAINPAQITDFNSWASWYNQLNYTSRSKQIKNFLIFNP
jgi:hypothetical protein